MPDKSKPYVFASSNYKVASCAFKKNSNNDNKIYDYVNKKNSSFKATKGLYSGMRMSADGKYILAYDQALTYPGEITVWDANTGKIMFTRTDITNDAHFTPDSKYVIAIVGKRVCKIGIDGKEIFKVDTPIEFFKLTVSADSKYVYAKDYEGFVMISAETGKIEKKIPYKISLFGHCIFTEDGSYVLLVVEDKKDKTLTLSVVETNW